MKFLKLKIHNFLTIGDANEISLDDRGLVLIQGINDDDTSATSNGVGKSSIPDALCWALYGQTARDESGDAVVNNVAKKDCFVRVLLQDGESRYSITRYRKHKEFKNQTVVRAWSGEGYTEFVDISKGTEKETQEVINGIMGCSLDVFMAAIYAGQEQMPDLPKMTDKQLKLLIEEAAGVQRLEGAYLKAREKLNGVKSILDMHTKKSEDIRARLVDTHAKKITASAQEKEYEELRDGVRANFLSKAEEIREEILRLGGQLVGLDEKSTIERMKSLDAHLKSHDKLVAQEREIIERQSSAERILTRAQSTAAVTRASALRIKAVIDNAPEEMKKPCPECGKPHTAEELDSYVAVQRANLIKQIEQAKFDAAAEETAARVVNEVTSELTSFRKGIPDVSVISSEKMELQAKLKQISDLRNKLTLAANDRKLVLERAEAAMTTPNPHHELLAHLAASEDSLKSELDYEATAITELRERHSLLSDVVKIFGPAGVRAHILDSVTPFLNDRTADYLSALSDGNISAVWSTLSTTAKGELKEKFNIDVENDKGSKTFKGLSGGEKRKVRLATMLALQDLVASRASKPISLWVGDEVDDALDAAGLERLMGVLERKARERGTVLVVSHAELRDWIDNVVTVTKRGGYSTVDGVLCDD